jgi:hypothetical protein
MALLRRPAVADGRRAHLRPGPVHAAVDLVDEAADAGLVGLLAVEEALRMQRAHQQQRGVDGGQLAAPEAQPRLHVEEVIEEALVAGHAGPARALRQAGEEAQRRERALAGLLTGDVAARHTHRVGAEREADGRDAGEGRRGPAVRRQAGLGVGRVPEEVEGAAFEVGEEGVGTGRVRAGPAGQRTGQRQAGAVREQSASGQ